MTIWLAIFPTLTSHCCSTQNRRSALYQNKAVLCLIILPLVSAWLALDASQISWLSVFAFKAIKTNGCTCFYLKAEVTWYWMILPYASVFQMHVPLHPAKYWHGLFFFFYFSNSLQWCIVIIQMVKQTNVLYCFTLAGVDNLYSANFQTLCYLRNVVANGYGCRYKVES